ncbi:hypothetical protein predicted by Glimmer/Critica (plasmid) [Sinorhizobium fredii HH103]|uniref:Uncharacterized protein n=1 Tax=Sinorhizobium fredii (strain HH103) TaxID=1117943 RepID=G9AGH1_SINF1|nr:hypothetical protein predicted by Glimmer/Critica [Sinorhizobium fredii HH103]
MLRGGKKRCIQVVRMDFNVCSQLQFRLHGSIRHISRVGA